MIARGCGYGGSQMSVTIKQWYMVDLSGAGTVCMVFVMVVAQIHSYDQMS